MIVGEIQLWKEGFGTAGYAFPLIAAAIMVPALTAALAVKRGIDIGSLTLCLSALVVATIVGSRLLYWWTNPSDYRDDPWRVLALDMRDFSLYGGLILAGLTAMIVCRLANINIWTLADCAAPALGLGIAVTRVGCFLKGCCFGVPTNVPWAVVYPIGSPAHLHQINEDVTAVLYGPRAVHPTQVYEMLAAIASAIAAVVLLRRRLPDGVPFLAGAVIFTSFRWFNDPLRADGSSLVTTGWSYQMLYLMLILAGLLALVWRLWPHWRHTTDASITPIRRADQ
jgi:phosphatidylglycerol:prolipoprotein diacylglycerol transferase